MCLARLNIPLQLSGDFCVLGSRNSDDKKGGKKEKNVITVLENCQLYLKSGVYLSHLSVFIKHLKWF